MLQRQVRRIDNGGLHIWHQVLFLEKARRHRLALLVAQRHFHATGDGELNAVCLDVDGARNFLAHGLSPTKKPARGGL
ncbi:hypothetical protein D3C85_1486080 [compost metagenome]